MVEISFKKCRNHQESVFEHYIVFLLPHKAPCADALQNDTEDSSTDGEQIKGKEVADESSERKTANFLYA